MDIHIHGCIHPWTSIYMHIQIHSYAHTHVCIHTNTLIRTYPCVYTHKYTDTHISMYMDIRIHGCIYPRVYPYTWIYRYTHTHTFMYTDIHIHEYAYMDIHHTHISMSVSKYMYMCVWVYLCGYTHGYVRMTHGYVCIHTHTSPHTGWAGICIDQFPQKSPIISGSFATTTCNLRHPMGLRHPVPAWIRGGNEK